MGLRLSMLCSRRTQRLNSDIEHDVASLTLIAASFMQHAADIHHP